MVIQYPHICTYTTQVTPDVWDDVNGGWIPGTPGELVAVPCRVVPSGNGKKTRGEDGTMMEYAYDIAFPIEVPDIAKGQNVTLTKADGTIITEGHLLDFNAGQLHKLASI